MANWTLFSFNAAQSPWNEYCVATYTDCTKLYVYKHDKRNYGNTDFDGCTNSLFLNTTMYIGPSELQTVNLDAWVPYGIPAGDMAQSILTVYAEE